MSKAFDKLVSIMERLRAPNGCPWDRKQDLDTLRPYLLEETYELLEAMEKKDWELIKEELGDLLLQIVFISQIAKEQGKFTVDDVAEIIANKLVHRHPHVFGREKRDTPEQVESSWEELKRKEGKSPYPKKERGIPALLYAYRASKKASKLGFDWPDPQGAFEKVVEELEELKESYKKGEGRLRLEEEIGDLLFACANLSRLLKINPEEALRRGVDKFVDRFLEMVKPFKGPEEFKKLSLEEMDELWEGVKEGELKRLLKEKALSYSPQGFKLASGATSNYYVDCRKVLYTQRGCFLASSWLLNVAKELKADSLICPAYGGIPMVIGASLLGFLDGYLLKPAIIRKEKKDHGLGGNILGSLEKDDKVLAVDDVITTGGSVKKAVDAAKELGCHVVGVACLVDRREKGGELDGLKVVSLTTLKNLIS